MRKAMADAEVGDDGYGEDPTVRALEEAFAERVGKAAAVYVPSGTMGNQIALRLLGAPGTSVIAGQRSHVVAYEQGAFGTNGSAQALTVDDRTGSLDPAEVAWFVEAGGPHHWLPVSAVCVENTHMPSGGRPWPLEHLAAIASLGVPVHLDGARLFNAEVATGIPAATYAAHATTVMCCLSKGLGAPVGSMLAGAADLIEAARVERKRLGGAMRQAGVVAAAGLVALDHNVERLADDHARARRLVDAVGERWGACGLDPATAATNVVVFAPPDPAGLLAHLAAAGVRAATIAVGVVRLVTHLDVDDAAIDRTVAALRSSPA
ncbi:MAG: DegT/DnrJ/EryC1/StrS family aminotransferase [Acidimicrobiia bacterium]|nr:DegT/DnrJ/EryC1/StrS family aminotransferase [Acidimicrobiia bacterium]